MRRTGLLAGVVGLTLVLSAGPKAAQAQVVVSGGIGVPGFGLGATYATPGTMMAPAPVVAAPIVAAPVVAAPAVVGYSAWGYPAYGPVVGMPMVRPVAPIYRYPAYGPRYGYAYGRRGWR